MVRGGRAKVAIIIIAAAGLVTFISLSVVFLVWARRQIARNASPNTDPPPAAERAKRLTPVAEIAPAPMPQALPLRGPIGHDAEGYPTQYVDRPALRSLLAHQRYADLNRYFEEFQASFEADLKREYWPIDAGDSFASAEPELGAALDGWVAATPDAFPPYLARGTYWTTTAFVRRGSDWARNTAGEDFDAMRDALIHASADLEHALSMRPKLVAARRQQLLARDSKKARAILDQALAVCPSCFQIRITYIYTITPRWGGSYEAMRQFATQSANPAFPRLKLLKGYENADRADLLDTEKKYEEALVAIQRACSLGEHWEFLLDRAKTENRKGDLVAAKKDLDRAIELRPGRPEMLFERASVSRASSQWESAGRDLLEALRSNPTDANGRWLLDRVIAGLVYEGWEHYRAHRKNDALRVYDLAAELAPKNGEVQSRRGSIVMGVAPQEQPPEIAALEAAAEKAPDDFRAHQALDYALAKRGEYARVVGMWDDYIQHHPDDGPAHLERGGAYHHLQRRKEAQADVARACELGVSEGCLRVKQLAGN
jgi:tetratricopeptide (TPR) repeat protein